MRIAVLIISLLFLAGIAYAEQAKVYTDQDLNRYSSQSTVDSGSYDNITTTRDKEVFRSLSQKGLEILALDIPKDKKCDMLRDLQARINIMSHDSKLEDMESTASSMNIRIHEMCDRRR